MYRDRSLVNPSMNCQVNGQRFNQVLFRLIIQYQSFHSVVSLESGVAQIIITKA